MVRHAALISAARPAAIASAAANPCPRVGPVLAAVNGVAALPTRPPRGLCVLTTSGLLQTRPRLGALLGAAGCAVRAVARWADLVDAIEDAIENERMPAVRAGVALVDLDAANRAAIGGAALSGYRLVALLARRARACGFALVVQTALDYSEIDDLVRLGGVCALPHPDLTDEQIAAQLQSVLRGWGAPALPRTDVAELSASHPVIPALADITLAEAAPWGAPSVLAADAAQMPPAFG